MGCLSQGIFLPGRLPDGRFQEGGPLRRRVARPSAAGRRPARRGKSCSRSRSRGQAAAAEWPIFIADDPASLKFTFFWFSILTLQAQNIYNNNKMKYNKYLYFPAAGFRLRFPGWRSSSLPSGETGPESRQGRRAGIRPADAEPGFDAGEQLHSCRSAREAQARRRSWAEF